MASVIAYFYKENKFIRLSKGYKRDMAEYVESFILNYADDIQGNKIKNFKDLLKGPKEYLTNEEWDNNRTILVNQSKKNKNKYTIKQQIKLAGYCYNSFKKIKLATIYYLEHDNEKKYKQCCREDTEFNYYHQFNNVISELQELHGFYTSKHTYARFVKTEIVNPEKEHKNKFDNVISELKDNSRFKSLRRIVDFNL